MKINAEISVGELIDKISILEIKQDRISSPDALKNVRRELHSLSSTLGPLLKTYPGIAGLKTEIGAVNTKLWDIENEIRLKESQKDFGEAFVELARSVYFQNDKRSVIKRKINDLVGSEIVEEKSYGKY